MHDIERYLIWGAIIVLFVLYFWPKPSMYTGEPHSLTKLDEFALLNDDIKKLYNNQINRAMKAWAPTINKWWTDLASDKKAQINVLVQQAADQVVTNATNAKALNGNDVIAKYFTGGSVYVASTVPPMPTPAAPTTPMPSPAARTPTTGSYFTPSSPSTTSRYMTEPFTPMVSTFSLQEALNKVTTATKVN